MQQNRFGIRNLVWPILLQSDIPTDTQETQKSSGLLKFPRMHN